LERLTEQTRKIMLEHGHWYAEKGDLVQERLFGPGVRYFAARTPVEGAKVLGEEHIASVLERFKLGGKKPPVFSEEPSRDYKQDLRVSKGILEFHLKGVGTALNHATKQGLTEEVKLLEARKAIAEKALEKLAALETQLKKTVFSKLPFGVKLH